jgi:UV excision repair protein RAD23
LDSKASVIEKQKLIHSGKAKLWEQIELKSFLFLGKILVNEKTVESCGIKEGDFLVLMISSTISATKPKETVTAGSANVSGTSATATSSTSIIAAASTAVTPPSEQATVAPRTSPSIAVNEEAVNSICEMGFPKEEVIRALKASFNNLDRAVEYLTNGIPDGAVDAADEDDLEVGAGSAGGEEFVGDLSENPLANLLKSPQFMQFRMVVQQEPRLLGPLLEQIAQNNPDVLEMIKENQEAFMQIIQTPLTEAEMQVVAQSVDSDGEGEGAEVDEEGNEGVDPTSVIQVTEEEQAAIERLMALGFDRPRVIEAYFACDKNETIAANFLFEHMNDDDF